MTTFHALGNALDATAHAYPSAPHYLWPWPVGGYWTVRREGKPVAAFIERDDALEFADDQNRRHAKGSVR